MAFQLAANLILNTQAFAKSLTSASQRMNTFAKSLNKQYSQANEALTKHNMGLKDTARIVQGIIISQAFYTVARSITEATRALTEFNEQLDYANVTYSALFGDTQIANDFVKALQAKSVETIFDYQTLADASKKMLAYGIEYKNLMFTLNGLTNLGAMSGDVEALNRIALAIGQINTRGTLKAEEMRQLANAYVPIYDIIKTKFGLSGEEMGRVGDLNLPAYKVINAIVDYANERFGSVGEAVMYTITGLKNRIVDTIKVMASEMLMPLTMAWKSFLAYFANSLDSLRSVYSSAGWGGVFEKLVPNPETQTIIRAFIANLLNGLRAILSMFAALAPAVKAAANAFMIAFNIVAPVITGLANVLAVLLKALLENKAALSVLRFALIAAAGAFVVLKVHAVAALAITAVTKAVLLLSRALLVLSKHPLVMLFTLLGVALIGVAAASNNANNSLSGLFRTLSGAGGALTQNDILQKTQKDINDTSEALSQFNNRFDDGTGAIDDLTDSLNNAGKAAKKNKGLLSFDEVFKLPDNAKDAAGGSVATDLEGLINGLGVLGANLIPEIPDFTEYIKEFTDNLFGGLEKGIMEKLKRTALGSLIGAGIVGVIGGLVGGPVGAKIGAAIGALAGSLVAWFWDDLKVLLETTDKGMFGVLFGGAFGAAIGFTMGGVPGMILGSVIGTLVSGLMTYLWSRLGEVLGKGPDSIERAQTSSAMGAGIGAMLGLVVGGPGGAAIGAGIGLLVGGLFGMFKDEIVAFFKSDKGLSTTLGAGIGAMLGAPAGPIGIGVGALVGGIVGFFSDKIVEYAGELWKMGGEMIDGILQGMKDWAAEHIPEPIKDFFDWVIQGFKDIFGIHSPATAMMPIGNNIIEGLLQGMKDAFKGVLSWVFESGEKLLKDFNKWWDGLKLSTEEALIYISDKWSEKWTEIKKNVSTKWTEIKNNANIWWSTFKTGNLTFLEEVRSGWASKWEEIKLAAIAKWSEIKTNASTWWTNLKTDTVLGLSNIKSEWSTKWGEIKTNMSTWWNGMRTSMGSWLENSIWNPIEDFFDLDNFWNRIKDMLDDIKRKLSSWWSSVTSIFEREINVNVSTSGSGGSSSSSGGSSGSSGGGTRRPIDYSSLGHATGGIFTREHVARFAEGNKAEAVIPLENASAMQPFVNAISQGILEGLAPVIVQSGSSESQLPPMYVGTLIADERGLKQLYKKMEVIQVQENTRRGIVR